MLHHKDLRGRELDGGHAGNAQMFREPQIMEPYPILFGGQKIMKANRPQESGDYKVN